MIKNYFKTAFRILARNKIFSIINVLGLSIALASVLIIFLFISYQLGFDKHHSNYDNIYRINTIQKSDGQDGYKESTPVPLSTLLKNNLTGHKHITQIFFSSNELVRIGNNKYMESGFLFADTNFVKVFDVEFIQGNPDDLRKINTVFLTEKYAIKYFGSVENAINNEIILRDTISYNVAGVVKNPPKRTHLVYNFLLSWSSINRNYFTIDYNSYSFLSTGLCSYLTLNDGVSPSETEALIQKIFTEKGSADKNEEDRFMLQALKDIHFDNRFSALSDSYIIEKNVLWVFAIVAFFILLIAFINFTNLSVVQAIKRSKEVGIRKVLGASRKKLIMQFLGETFLIIFLAEIIALIFTEIVLDDVNVILGAHTQLHLYGNLSIVLFVVLTLLILTFISGIYPASVLSRYNPIKALRYNLKIRRKKPFSMYNILVVLQFLISQILIVCVFVISLQIQFINNKDLGFDKENVISIHTPKGKSDKVEVFKELLLSNPKIEKLSQGIGAPQSGDNFTSNFNEIGRDASDLYANLKTVDENYQDFYKLKLLAGKWYLNSSYNDSIAEVVVNNTLVKSLGYKNPSDILDKYLKTYGAEKSKVIGVVDDFHIYNMKKEISPVIFCPLNTYFSELSIKVSKGQLEKVLPAIETAWNKVFPDYIFSYSVLENKILERYSFEKRLSKIIKIATFIAIFIACMGLFGLVSFVMVQRTKEIGIRKALGASVSSLMILVSKQFLYLVIISCLFAWPLSYYIMKQWLLQYAYKIELNVWIFAVSGIILLLITFITIFYQSIKVALTNPVEVLKYE
ncbi:MAG: ABC transporter permease [Bacteroidales bacterium]|nr:ABC transporter permease [Bacteroidales bacterium]